jgi:hypothetical protein
MNIKNEQKLSIRRTNHDYKWNKKLDRKPNQVYIGDKNLVHVYHDYKKKKKEEMENMYYKLK